MSVTKNDSLLLKLSTETCQEGGTLDRALLTWKITDFLSRAENADEELSSPEFWCSGALWRLSLYPYGQSSCLSTVVVVFYLHKIHHSEENHRAFFQFRIPLKGGVEVHKCHVVSEIFIGNDKVCGGMVPRNTISIKSHGFLPGGVLTIFCDVAITTNASSTIAAEPVKVNNALIEDYDNLVTLSQDFETLYNNPTFADVNLKFGEHEFPAHRSVLKIRSKVFSAIFDNKIKEHQQDRAGNDIKEQQQERTAADIKLLQQNRIDDDIKEQQWDKTGDDIKQQQKDRTAEDIKLWQQDRFDDGVKDQQQERVGDDIKEQQKERTDDDINKQQKARTDDDINKLQKDRTDDDMKEQQKDRTDDDEKLHQQNRIDHDMKEHQQERIDDDVKKQQQDPIDDGVKEQQQERTDDDIKEQQQKRTDEDIKEQRKDRTEDDEKLLQQSRIDDDIKAQQQDTTGKDIKEQQQDTIDYDVIEQQQDTIYLAEMDADTAKDILRYIYCGKVRHLSSEEALKLYVAADRYELLGLVPICRRVLMNHLSIDNFHEITTVASEYNDQLLIDSVKSLISNNMKKVLKSEIWKKFSIDNPVLSLNLIETVLLNE